MHHKYYLNKMQIYAFFLQNDYFCINLTCCNYDTIDDWLRKGNHNLQGKENQCRNQITQQQVA